MSVCNEPDDCLNPLGGIPQGSLTGLRPGTTWMIQTKSMGHIRGCVRAFEIREPF